MFTSSEIFDLAIQVEINGEQIYRRAAQTVTRESLREFLDWLANEETRHRSEFQKIRDKIGEAAISSESTAGLSQDESMALRHAMGRHAFSLDDLKVESIQDEEEILKTAILFEEDAIGFFEFIASMVSDASALATIDLIRREELNHKSLLVNKLSEF